MKFKLITLYIVFIFSMSNFSLCSADMSDSVQAEETVNLQQFDNTDLTPVIEETLDSDFINNNQALETWINENEDNGLIVESFEDSLLGLN